MFIFRKIYSTKKHFQNPDLILSMLDESEHEKLNKNTMKNIFKNSNKFNTYFTTEYNVINNRKVRLPAGVGNNNLGLLLQKKNKYKKLPQLKNPYLVAYIAGNVSNESQVENALSCLGYFYSKSFKKKIKVKSLMLL